MLLSLKLPITTTVILVLTAIVNVYGFEYFTELHTPAYFDELPTTNLNTDLDQIQLLMKLGQLDAKTQEEYVTILKDLNKLSTSVVGTPDTLDLKNLTGATEPTGTIASVTKFFSPLSFSSLGEDSPEGRLIRKILRDLIFLNIFWVFLITTISFYWIKSIFQPIVVITENIRNIIERKRHARLKYDEKNEFRPLIETINGLQKSLSFQERIRSTFLSDLSHEIKTPITAVKCYLEAIEDGVMKMDEKTLTLLQKELNRLTEITHKIMEFESLTHDTKELIQPVRYDPREAIENIIQEYEPQLLKSGQKIQYEWHGLLNFDPSLFQQVLHNMVSNFIKYAGKNTTLMIQLERDEKKTRIIFSDNGVGIPEKDLSFVTEKFYRVDTGRNQADKSMGIGLSIVERIVRLHGGMLEVKNNTPKGALFILEMKS